MPRERPVLTARWTELLVLNFRVPQQVLAAVTPPGTEPDLYDGQSYLSIVGFRFHGTRLFGLPIPGHTSFIEINLRYYVRRYPGGTDNLRGTDNLVRPRVFNDGQDCPSHVVGSAWRRGVVFVKEIAPRRAIGAAANWLYNENYITRPMRAGHHIADTRLALGDRLEYAWRTNTIPLPFREGPGEGSARRAQAAHWNHLSARIAAPLKPPVAGSFEEFIIENYWGYVRGRDGRTREYQVSHDPWRVAPVADVEWNCDLAATYDAPFAEYLAAPPASALVADGSPIKLFRGRCI
jgi:uncharacterized protein